MDKYISFFNSPIGTLKIVTDGEFLLNVGICKDVEARHNCADRLCGEVQKQIGEYFDGKRTCFDLPYRLDFTGFRLDVLKAIATIPYGQTITYGELAARANRPKAYRSAGSSAGHNPLLIVVPCHRVVGANGIGGFGVGLEVKRYLLELERNRMGRL